MAAPRRSSSLHSKRSRTPAIRPARKGDMAGIRDLIRLFPGQLVQRNLPRLQSFAVADIGGKLVGCCALQVYSKRLAEVRSLSVHPDFQDAGVASGLVEFCKQRARDRGISELFAVTSRSSFFERLGFATFRREKTAMFFEVTPNNA
jgi:N-acetylglutamate synthase-like GNAT family acetyltransferase